MQELANSIAERNIITPIEEWFKLHPEKSNITPINKDKLER